MVGYLKRLAIENSSAFSGLLKSVLPTTLAAESDGGSRTEITFRRIIVFPGGREETDETTKQIAPPGSHTLPRSDEIEVEAKDIKELDS